MKQVKCWVLVKDGEMHPLQFFPETDTNPPCPPLGHSWLEFTCELPDEKAEPELTCEVRWDGSQWVVHWPGAPEHHVYFVELGGALAFAETNRYRVTNAPREVVLIERQTGNWAMRDAHTAEPIACMPIGDCRAEAKRSHWRILREEPEKEEPPKLFGVVGELIQEKFGSWEWRGLGGIGTEGTPRWWASNCRLQERPGFTRAQLLAELEAELLSRLDKQAEAMGRCVVPRIEKSEPSQLRKLLDKWQAGPRGNWDHCLMPLLSAIVDAIEKGKP